MKKIVFLLVMAIASVSSAQVLPPGGFTFVSVAPSGSCTNGTTAQMVISTGIIYTCQGATWTPFLSTTGGTLTGALTVPSLTVTGLPSGRCVQTTTGGQLTNTAGACGTASGTLTATGVPASGNLAFWSGATSLTNGDLTGDATTSGTSAVTLSTVNSNTGSFGSATAVPVISLDGKGRTLSASTANITAGSVGTLMEATGGGTAQAQTVTVTPAVSSLTNGLAVRWIPTATNTATAPTLAVNGLTATTITKCGGQALTAGDIPANIAGAVYTGSTFELMNPVQGCVVPTNYYSSFITGNVTMTSSATFYDIATVTVTAGTWIIRGAADVTMGAANSGAQCSIRDSSNTQYANGSAYVGGGSGTSSLIHIITPGIVVTVSSSTAFKVSCAGTVGGGVVQANPLVIGFGLTSGIDAFRIK